MSLVEKIKELCKNYKTSIPKLERELGLGHGSMYNWDTNSPSIDKVLRVADYFKVSINFLIGRASHNHSKEAKPCPNWCPLKKEMEANP